MDDIPIKELIRMKKLELKAGKVKKERQGTSCSVSVGYDEDRPLSEIFQDKIKALKKRSSKSKKSTPKAEKSSNIAKPTKKRKSSSSSSSKKEKKVKSETSNETIGEFTVFPYNAYQHEVELKPLEQAKENVKWWEQEVQESDETTNDKTWTSLKHNGVRFPEAYKPHGVPVFYEGQPIQLSPEAEEVATFYAVLIETDYVKNKVFRDNFFRDWKMILGAGHVIKKLEKCDFSKIHEWHMERKETLKELRKDPEYKLQQKEEKARLQEIYGYAIVNGVRQKVGNYNIEPPGLFRGRGDHPKTGTLKRRVMPEDVIINIGKGEKVPTCPIPGHHWKGIIHNDTVTWLAFWMENVNGGKKYVWLHPSSQFKGQSDLDKYEKARKLKKYIGKIRQDYMREMDERDVETRQRATAIWIIDVLALRAGNEKDTEDEADTVGCCSLRVEHLSYQEPNLVTFDFLGKDSMRYFNQVTVHEKVFRNLKEFSMGKSPDDQIFDKLTTTSLNQYLKSLMPGLTAKVFRTYNASFTLQQELRGPERDIALSKTIDEKIFFYNAANREVAILCNHQKSVSKSHDQQMDKMDDNLKKKKQLKKDLKAHLQAVLRGEPAPECENKIKTKKPEQLKQRIKKVDEMLKKMSVRKQLKEDNKSVALNTSKINYMDPRISVSWCKQKQVPIEKVFNKSALEKFPWAMEVGKSWEF